MATTTMDTTLSIQNASSEREHDEYQYLRLLKTVMDTGETRADRTGTGTLAIFGPPSLRFSLENNSFPLLTTKRVFLRGVIEELLWFVRGSTDARLLSERGVKIWDGNGSRAFLDARGLSHRREGDLGPVYGFQWRYFGAKYIDCETDYTGQGVDQLKEVIRKIKEDPTDRRIIMSAWNPAGASCLPSSTTAHLSVIRFITDGAPTLPHVLPVLCPPTAPGLSHQQAWALLPNVPTLRRSRSRHPIQHCLVRSVDPHDCPCHRHRGPRTHHAARRCTHLQRSRRASQDTARAHATTIPNTQIRAPVGRHRRLSVRRLHR